MKYNTTRHRTIFAYIDGIPSDFGLWQAFEARIALLHKEGGGHRPIAILTMLYRIWCKIRKPETEAWCEKKAAHWDAAVKGSS